MAKNKDWIVFKTLEDKWDAIHFDRMDDEADEVQNLHDQGCRIQGFVFFPTKNEAINYIMEMTRR